MRVGYRRVVSNIVIVFKLITQFKNRSVKGRFSIPYRQETIRIFWRSQQPVNKATNTLNKLLASNLRGALNRGNYSGALLSTLKQTMGMLTRGRVDFIIEGYRARRRYIKTHQLTNNLDTTSSNDKNVMMAKVKD